MSTSFAYVTHATPRIPVRDTATKRITKDRPVYSRADRITYGSALLTWERANPFECTQDFDGICRCKLGA